MNSFKNAFQYNIVVATDSNYGFGAKGKLPWDIPLDLKFFKFVTSSTQDDCKKNIVVMGRVTWDSIPDKFKPLKGRINIVFTQDSNYVKNYSNVENSFYVVSSISQFENVVESLNNTWNKIFLIGGMQIIKLFEERYPNRCSLIFHTLILKEYKECDTFYRIQDNSGRKILTQSEEIECKTSGTKIILRILTDDKLLQFENLETKENVEKGDRIFELYKVYIQDFLNLYGC